MPIRCSFGSLAMLLLFGLVGGSLQNEIRVQEVQECKQSLGFVYCANTTGFAGKKAFSKHSLEVSITQ